GDGLGVRVVREHHDLPGAGGAYRLEHLTGGRGGVHDHRALPGEQVPQAVAGGHHHRRAGVRVDARGWTARSGAVAGRAARDVTGLVVFGMAGLVVFGVTGGVRLRIVEPGDGDPVRPAGLHPGLDRRADVVDVHVHVPGPVPT